MSNNNILLGNYPPKVYADASGGNLVVASGYKTHTFSSVGTSTFQVTVAGYFEFLIVAGGGGGGNGINYCGGGGAGGVLYYGAESSGSSNGTPKQPNGSPQWLAVGTYNIVVGAGGAVATNGGNSSAFGYTAIGGGAGSSSYATAGNNGGSGGGGGPVNSSGGTGVDGQGYKGGNSSSANQGAADSSAGGGGGAQGSGEFANSWPYTNSPGAGGPGVKYSISGTPTFYAAGGSGSGRYYASSSDGIGGAANGAIPAPPYTTCTSPNNVNGSSFGSGGAGAASGQVCASSAGTGSSGVVIVRYASPKLRPGTITNPATSGNEIYAFDPASPSGLYYLKSPGGVVYQAYIEMTNNGGWIRLNAGAIGPYTTPLTSSWGTGGGDMLTGASTTLGAAIAASYVYNGQAISLGCPGANGASHVVLNQTMFNDLAITQVRWKASVTSMDGNVVCGYINSSQSNITLISGTSNMLSVCNNTPNRYSDVNPGTFTLEAYGTISNSMGTRDVFNTWTACGGSYYVRIDELYVR